MLFSRREVLGGAIALPAFVTGRAAAQTTRIRYLLTSPTPTVAEAPHASVPTGCSILERGRARCGCEAFQRFDRRDTACACRLG